MSGLPRVLMIGLLTLLACGPAEEPLLQPTANTRAAIASTELTCGMVLTSNVTLSADITCPSGFTGTVFQIGSDGIVFDGAGHVIDAPDAAAIFSVRGRSGVVIRNVIVSEGRGSGAGISLYAVRNSSFSHIQVSGRLMGINGSEGWVHDNTFTDNTLSGNGYGIYIRGGDSSPQAGGNTFSRNDFSSNRTWGLLLTELSGFVVTPDNEFAGCANGMQVTYSSNTLIENLQFAPNIPGSALSLRAATGMTVRNISAHGTQGSGSGLDLYAVRNSSFSHIQVSGRLMGINGSEGWVHDNIFTDSTLSGNGYGIFIRGGDSSPQAGGNTFSHNLLANNTGAGLQLSAVDGSLVGPGNIIRDNAVGVLVHASRGVKIVRNTIVGNNSFGVATQTSLWVVDARYNYWGYPSGPLDQNVPVEGINDSLGLSNPGGQGNAVTDFILYSPFCTEPAGC